MDFNGKTQNKSIYFSFNNSTQYTEYFCRNVEEICHPLDDRLRPFEEN